MAYQAVCSSERLDPDDLAQMRQAAVQAAQAAGRVLMGCFRRSSPAETVEPHDVKLEADRLSEDAVVSTLARSFPEDAVLAEERGFQPGRSDRVWVIDPLDGSVNFCHGIPHFAVSVACYRRVRDRSKDSEGGGPLSSLGVPVVGVVYAPFFDELFVGAKGRGATCNDLPIAVGQEKSVSEAVIGFSLGSREETMSRMCAVSASLVRDVRKMRIFGSTALDMAHVACGRMSALVQGRVRSWDVAAGRVILEESGGVFHARSAGPEGWEIIASAPGIYPYLKERFPRLTD